MSDHKLLHDALAQIELADGLGYDHVWTVEHHFLEEYSHSAAPEVFLGAVSQRTKQIRIGHGINLTAPGINHPARIAERVSTLDLLSNGRIEWGTGESATYTEIEGFALSFEEKGRMWREGAEQAANMMTMTPYPGYEGEYFKMPTRNVLPKPFQKPHPPMWLACSRYESIIRAAENGLGALVFGFVTPSLAAEWAQAYYDVIKSDRCVPLGHSVNANLACVCAMSVHHDEQEALARGMDGFRFFGFSIGHHAVYGTHRPGVTNLWEEFQKVRDKLPNNPGEGGIGTPAQVIKHLSGYADAGVDQMIFMQQTGHNKHEHIMSSLELCAAEVMPQFKEKEAERQAKKQAELAPYIEAALARKKKMAPIAEADIPGIKATGVRREEATGASYANGGVYSDPRRGGGINIPASDPRRP
jgi:alkanesulfonate monooxygenase SsuD/methylene tetrahydromethanopterin reductase-like flavin-dependent oxidoreductase (luciferase family)